MRNFIYSLIAAVTIKLCTALIVTTCFFGKLYGQNLERSIISNLGSEIKRTQLIIDFSLGETIVSYNKSPSLLISCGFHQGATLVSSINSPESPLKDLLIYPNPTIERIHIENPSGSELKYRIYDIYGRITKSGEFEEWKQTVNVELLKEGMYILTISDALRNSLSFKFIKI